MSFKVCYMKTKTTSKLQNIVQTCDNCVCAHTFTCRAVPKAQYVWKAQNMGKDGLLGRLRRCGLSSFGILYSWPIFIYSKIITIYSFKHFKIMKTYTNEGFEQSLAYSHR